MSKILAIAKNTFKETIRDRILYAILGFAILFILSTNFLGSLSLGEDIKIIKDLGLAAIYIFSLIIAIFIGTSLVYKEIEKRTIFVTLSKPVSKAEFIVGKFLGLLSSMIIILFLMTVIYLIVIAVKGGGFDWRGIIAIIMSLIEIALFISLSILFSTFSTPLASTIYAVLLLYIGHSLNMVLDYFSKNEGFGLYIFKIFYYLLPNLEKFNLRNLVVHNDALNALSLTYSCLYGISYIIILLLFATWSLDKQEL